MQTNSITPFANRYAGLSWPLILGAFTFLGFLACGNMLLEDNDTYAHIAIGRWIIGHTSIPSYDVFSHTMPGSPWTAHEWLAEVILALVYQTFSWTGVIALTAAAFAGTIAILTRFLLKNLEPVHALMFAALAVMMSAPHILARPHVLAMPLLVVWSAYLVRASEQGRTPSFWLLPVMVLWANLHGGFTFGLALALFFAIEAVINARKKNETLAAAKSWALFVGLSLTSALITPHGIKGILFTAHLLNGNYALDRIGEWQSPNFHTFQPLEVWLLFGLAVALHQGLRLPFMRLILLIGLLHLSLNAVRHIELLGLLMPLFLAAPLVRQWRERSTTGHQLTKVDLLFRSLISPARHRTVTLTIVVLTLITLLSSLSSTHIPKIETTLAPALQAVKQAKITGPVLNEYSFGGYLIFADIPPFIDGRADMYGDDFIKEYISAVYLTNSDGLPRLLEKYHIEWTLMSPSSPTVALLDHLPEWHRLYADKIAVVHVRNIVNPSLRP
jgi:hypothetical protein